MPSLLNNAHLLYSSDAPDILVVKDIPSNPLSSLSDTSTVSSNVASEELSDALLNNWSNASCCVATVMVCSGLVFRGFGNAVFVGFRKSIGKCEFLRGSLDSFDTC